MPQLATEYLTKARQYHQNGDVESAELACIQALRRVPSFLDAWKFLAELIGKKQPESVRTNVPSSQDQVYATIVNSLMGVGKYNLASITFGSAMAFFTVDQNCISDFLRSLSSEGHEDFLSRELHRWIVGANPPRDLIERLMPIFLRLQNAERGPELVAESLQVMGQLSIVVEQMRQEIKTQPNAVVLGKRVERFCEVLKRHRVTESLLPLEQIRLLERRQEAAIG